MAEPLQTGLRADCAPALDWIGTTVYPDVPKLRLAFGSRALLTLTLLRLKPERLTLSANALSLVYAADNHPAGYEGAPEARLELPVGSQKLAEGTPLLYYTPEALLVAALPAPDSFRAWAFRSPGELAETRIPLLPPPARQTFADAAEALRQYYLVRPFLSGAAPAPEPGPAFTQSGRRALAALFDDSPADECWTPRGEPGDFAIRFTRRGNVWQAVGLTSEAKTLTIRLEDLILRTPAALRAREYDVAIIRDPIQDEAPAELIEETFPAEPDNIRVALDLPANGGCIVTYTPAAKE